MIRVYLMFQGERVCNALYVSLSLSLVFSKLRLRKETYFFSFFFLNFITIPRDYRIVYLKKKGKFILYEY